MKTRDILALAALAGGLKAFKDKADRDYAELPEQKEVAKRKKLADVDVSGSKFKKLFEGKDDRDEYRNATPEELRQARLKAIKEEPTLKNVTVDSSGRPIRSGSGFLKSKEYKKGGAVSASKRADGIAQRGKTRGRMV